ncbi:unnamed protein product [Gemmata massiliana]|uniref:Uncharacterized protein n=1 Tax=Gemmata massiliana TaxID=1210884 RepID=A0A6P2D4R5_9BACT|nr:unnamed protein product [Gemmata massiliana]
MPDFMKVYSLLKLGGFFLACFVGGAWLVYDGVAGKKGRSPSRTCSRGPRPSPPGSWRSV